MGLAGVLPWFNGAVLERAGFALLDAAAQSMQLPMRRWPRPPLMRETRGSVKYMMALFGADRGQVQWPIIISLVLRSIWSITAMNRVDTTKPMCTISSHISLVSSGLSMATLGLKSI